MEDHYGMSDLRHFINNRPLFSTPIPPAPSQHHRNLAPPTSQQHYPHYEMVVMPPAAPPYRGGFHHDYLVADSSTNNNAAAAATGGGGGGASSGGMEMEAGGGYGDGGNGRWPRQETLTLLEIRSRLDSKFKEANQKGPIWDEVSRIMCEEYGYQRSGKKCREKFENLYKYYKKTKEGKAGRQDGKHYRFFRQLEALYGTEISNNNNSRTNNSFCYINNVASNNNYNVAVGANDESNNSLSLSNSSGYDTTSSDESDPMIIMDGCNKKRKGKGKWRAKIKDFIDGQMRKLMEKQEAWLEKIMKTIESKEQERMLREEEWRKQEVSRIEMEQKFWANERAWIESRDSALMEAFHKVTGTCSDLLPKVCHSTTRSLSTGNEFVFKPIETCEDGDDNWGDNEITKLIQIRNNMEARFEQHIGCSDDVLWEEIGRKMSFLGYERSGTMCRDKWIHINNYLIKCNKKRKDDDNNNNNNGSSYYFQNISDKQQHGGNNSYYAGQQQQHPINMAGTMNDSCFRLLQMGDAAENLWENYGMKLNKGTNGEDK